MLALAAVYQCNSVPDIPKGFYAFNPYWERFFTRHRLYITLIHVCKKWWCFWSPPLYRSITIMSNRDLESLTQALTPPRPRSKNGYKVHSLGPFVVQLDIAVPGCHSPDHAFNIRLMDAIINLLLPNLSTVGFIPLPGRWTYDPDYELGYVLQRILSTGNLTTINLAGLYKIPRYVSLWDLRRFLVSNVNLQTLACHDEDLTELVTPIPLNGRQAIALHNITSLALFGALETTHGFTTYFTFPSLKELTCSVPESGENANGVREHFFKTHGAKLDTLHIKFSNITPQFNVDLLWIKERCPSLRRLTLTIPKGEHFPVDPANIPAYVEYLALRITWYPRRLYYRRMIVFIRSLECASPQLRTVQFIGDVYSPNLLSALFVGRIKRVKAMRKFVRRCKLTLLDQYGRPWSGYL
ncbi:hypothetical protein PAXINDRAFT_179197 [Paxillus involutus ATCC 200175]|nr:hypothetical protein PAXINDRAFT_179197 [Paxillus involutus ATCC 200175]